MSGALDAFCDAQDYQRQFKQNSRNENTDEERNDSHDQVDQPLRGRLLITKYDASYDHDSAKDDPENIQKLNNAASELVLEREVEESRKEILFFGHAASLAHKSVAIAGVILLVRQVRAGSQEKGGRCTVTFTRRRRRLRILEPTGEVPFLLTIEPLTYILIGFAASPVRQCGGGGANSCTYDQGPALLSR